MRALALFLVLTAIMIVLTPFAAIWAINTLFQTAIPMTFWTWLAALILMLILSSLGVKRYGK